MKALACSLLFVLGLALALPAPAYPQALDQIRLKDGRTVSGQIVEEGSKAVVMLVDGVRRSYDRSFIAAVSYAGDGGSSGPDVPQGTYAPAPSDAEPAPGASGGYAPGPSAASVPESALIAGISNRYRVSPRDVEWVLAQGVDEADVPLVFLIAATARVTPRQVLALRAQGYDWDQIEQYYQMQPDAVDWEPGPLLAYPVYEPAWCWWDSWPYGYGWGWPYGYGYGWGYGGWGGYGWGRGGYYGRGGWSRGGYAYGHGWGGGIGRVPVGAGRGGWSGAGRGWSSGARSGGGRSSAGFPGGGGSSGGGRR